MSTLMSEKLENALDKISTMIEEYQTKGTTKDFQAFMLAAPLLQAVFIGRAAAELAKLREHFEKVDESVFGGKNEGKEKKVQEAVSRNESPRSGI